MIQFDYDDLVRLKAHLLMNILLLAIVLVFPHVGLLKPNPDVGLLNLNLFRFVYPITIIVYGLDLLLLGFWYYRYRKSAIYQLNRVERYCKKNKLAFNKIETDRNGLTVYQDNKVVYKTTY